MLRTTALVMMFAVLTACSREDARPAPVKRDVEARPALSNATQVELATEIDDAERRGTWREVKMRWQGQRLRWTVTRQRVLCRTADACYVAAFPIQRPAQHGWLPKLELSTAELSKLEAACGDREQCQLTFEGTLRELALSADLPTSVRFGDVKVIAAGES